MALYALQNAEGKSSAGIWSCLSPFNFSDRAAALRLLNNSSVNFSKFLFSSVAGKCGGFEDVSSKETACSCEEIHFWGARATRRVKRSIKLSCITSNNEPREAESCAESCRNPSAWVHFSSSPLVLGREFYSSINEQMWEPEAVAPGGK